MGRFNVGVTNDLVRRVFEHREGLVEGFTKRYQVKKNIKHWPREWKIDLILSINPDWRDRYPDICR